MLSKELSCACVCVCVCVCVLFARYLGLLAVLNKELLKESPVARMFHPKARGGEREGERWWGWVRGRRTDEAAGVCVWDGGSFDPSRLGPVAARRGRSFPTGAAAQLCDGGVWSSSIFHRAEAPLIRRVSYHARARRRSCATVACWVVSFITRKHLFSDVSLTTRGRGGAAVRRHRVPLRGLQHVGGQYGEPTRIGGRADSGWREGRLG